MRGTAPVSPATAGNTGLSRARREASRPILGDSNETDDDNAGRRRSLCGNGLGPASLFRWSAAPATPPVRPRPEPLRAAAADSGRVRHSTAAKPEPRADLQP